MTSTPDRSWQPIGQGRRLDSQIIEQLAALKRTYRRECWEVRKRQRPEQRWQMLRQLDDEYAQRVREMLSISGGRKQSD